MLCSFLLYGKIYQLYTHIFHSFLRFFSQIGHYRVLSRVLCAIHQVLYSYLFYIQQCEYVNPNFLFKFPPIVYEGSLFFTSSPTSVNSSLFDNNHSKNCEVYLIGILICISPMIKSFHIPVVHLYAILGKKSTQVIFPFLKLDCLLLCY